MKKFALIIFTIFISHSLSTENFEQKLNTKIINQEFPNWMFEQIAEDLQPFLASGITKDMLDSVEFDPWDHLFARFEIRDGKLFSKATESVKTHPRFLIMTQMLENLLQRTSLPNLDMIITLQDYNFLGKSGKLLPIFSFAKHKYLDKTTILIPDYDVLTGAQEQMKQVISFQDPYPWRIKFPMAIWRGATTGANFTLDNFREYPRFNLVYLSLVHPKLINARFNLFAQMDQELDKYLNKWGFVGKFISIPEHLKFKYQILLDGNTCAYSRAYWQLFSNCLIFKHKSDNIQWYYRLLKEWVHYVPIEWNCNDLPEKIQWAKDHDREAQQIVENANKLARENLKLEDIYLYIYLLLTEYAKLQKF